MASSSNKPRCKHLLVSANDPGAAFQIGTIVRELQDLGSMEVTLIASGPALVIFRDQGLAPIAFDHPRAAQNDVGAATHLLAVAAALMESIQPDGLLVGLSGFDCGLDEALLACALDIPTFAIQDYWGDVNPGFGVLPATYFVLDEFAAQLTSRRAPNSKIIVTGSPRHQTMVEQSSAVLRRHYRDQMDVSSTGKIVTFVGQPLWHLSGYRRTLAVVAHSIAATLPGAQVIYRLHPRESPECWAQIEACFSSVSLSVVADPSTTIEASLCGADLLLSCYSNASLDGAILNVTSQEPLAAFVFVLIDPEVSAYFASSTGMQKSPLAHCGLVAEVKNEFGLNKVLLKCMTYSQRIRFQFMAKKYFGKSFNSVQRITQYLNININ